MTRGWIAGLLCALLSACASDSVGLGYYWQAVRGQVALSQAARPISEVRQDESVPLALRDKLARIEKMRDFASGSLGLPDNASYRAYTALDRSAVVWNVVAAPAWSLTPKTWCPLFVGCVSYLGYFSERAARAYAAELEAAGWDVHVSPVPAYSTLGWADDAVLSTFVNWPDAAVAGLIFHELAHQLLYVKGDTTFNESFASVVEAEGLRRWRVAQGLALAAEAEIPIEAEFAALLGRYRQRLTALYQAPIDLAKKAAVMADLQNEYKNLRKTRWANDGRYDAWFARGLNNAKLASVGFYQAQVPAFKALLAEQQGDLPLFYAQVKSLAQTSMAERQAQLLRLADGVKSAP